MGLPGTSIVPRPLYAGLGTLYLLTDTALNEISTADPQTPLRPLSPVLPQEESEDGGSAATWGDSRTRAAAEKHEREVEHRAAEEPLDP